MRRLFLAVALAVAATALASGSGLAVPDDAKGPPCGNITGNAQSDYYNPTATPDLRWTFALGGRSCESVTYTLYIYSFDSFGNPTPTLLATIPQTGTGSSATVVFEYTFAEGTAPSDGVCLVGTTTRKGNVVDRAPDADCWPVEVGGGGAQGGFG